MATKRVPGSGKNYGKGKGRGEIFGDKVGKVYGPKAAAKTMGAEGPKKSTPVKKRTLRPEAPGTSAGFRPKKKKGR
jgi:hypothetical protein